MPRIAAKSCEHSPSIYLSGILHEKYFPKPPTFLTDEPRIDGTRDSHQPTMTLCDLCRSIPLNDLPPFPPKYFTHKNGWRYINYFYPRELGLDTTGIGIPHQPDLRSLQYSAKTCDLCGVILGRLDLVTSQLKDLENDAAFIKMQGSGPPVFDLFLTQRKGGGNGFLVMCNGDNQYGIYLMAAVGICTEDGMYLDSKLPIHELDIAALIEAGDELAPLLPGRVVEEKPGEQTLRRAAAWVRECEQHSECSGASKTLPRSRASERHRSASPASRTTSCVDGKYVALSHC